MVLHIYCQRCSNLHSKACIPSWSASTRSLFLDQHSHAPWNPRCSLSFIYGNTCSHFVQDRLTKAASRTSTVPGERLLIVVIVFSTSLSPARNSGRFTWVRLQQLQEQRYPFLPVCPVFGIFNVGTQDAACDCTRDLCKNGKSLHRKLGEKSLAAPGTRTCVSIEPGCSAQCSTNCDIPAPVCRVCNFEQHYQKF